MPAKQLERAVGVTYKTAWRMKQMLLPLLTDPIWQPLLAKFQVQTREESWVKTREASRQQRRIDGEPGWKNLIPRTKGSHWKKKTKSVTI